jgi:hypothetical protein
MAKSRSARRLAVAACALALLPGCFTFTHTVGRGPQSSPPVQTEQHVWYALWGLAPIDEVDSQTLAGTSHDYRVTTEFQPMDVLITAFSSFVTLYRQTIVVEK